MGRTASILETLARTVAPSLVLTVSLAACSMVDRAAKTSPSHRSGAASITPTARPTSAGALMTGTQLKAVLLGQGDMPSGFTLNPKWAADSGSTVYPPVSATQTPPSPRACVQLTGAPWLPAAGVSPVSFAANGYRNVYSDEIDQMIAVYAETVVGQAIMTNLGKLFGLCSSFTSTSSGQKMRMRLMRSAGPALGDASIKGVMTSSVWQGGETLVAVRVGNAVVAVDYSSSGSDKGARAVTLAAELVARLRAAE